MQDRLACMIGVGMQDPVGLQAQQKFKVRWGYWLDEDELSIILLCTTLGVTESWGK